MANKKNIAAAGLSVACVGVLGYWLASPYLAIHEISSGAQERDADKVIKHVDFPAVRDDIKGQLIAIMTNKMQSDPEMANNPFAGLAAAFVVPMVNSIIDTYVTPSGIKGLMSAAPQEQGSSATGNPIESTMKQQSAGLKDTLSSASFNYDGFNKFVVTSKTPEGKSVGLKFTRFGFADWKLVSIALPPQ